MYQQEHYTMGRKCLAHSHLLAQMNSHIAHTCILLSSSLPFIHTLTS